MKSQYSRVGTPYNLAPAGTYDLLLTKFLNSKTWPEGEISFGLYDVPMKITGVQKVGQQFLRTLMTSKGSDPFYPNKGTNFSQFLGLTNISSNDTTLIAEISSCIGDANTQTRAMLNAHSEDPASMLDRVEVIGIQAVQEGWFVALRLITLAGDQASISLPFPQFGLNQDNVTDFGGSSSGLDVNSGSLQPWVTANFAYLWDLGHSVAPATAHLIDTSLAGGGLENEIISWAWEFGDAIGSTSNVKNPDFVYTLPGTYRVYLTVTDKYSNSSRYFQDLIVLTYQTISISSTTYGNTSLLMTLQGVGSMQSILSGTGSVIGANSVIASNLFGTLVGAGSVQSSSLIARGVGSSLMTGSGIITAASPVGLGNEASTIVVAGGVNSGILIPAMNISSTSTGSGGFSTATISQANNGTVIFLWHADNSLNCAVGGPLSQDGSGFFTTTDALNGYSYQNNGTSPGGGGSNVLYWLDQSTLDLGNNDFTIETWVWIAARQNRPRYLVNITDGSDNTEYAILIDTDGTHQGAQALCAGSPSAFLIGVNSQDTVPFNQWNHIAFTRQGNIYRIFINGTIPTNGSNSAAYRPAAGNKRLYLCNTFQGFVDGLYGLQDEVRIISGAALYTSNFNVNTVPVPFT